MVIKRGQIWWADLGEPRGSTPALRRPVLVVQDDVLNASSLKTVMVVPLTTNLRRAEAIGNVLLPVTESGLERASVALVCQVTTIDKASFDDLIGSLSSRAYRAVDSGLKLTLGLR